MGHQKESMKISSRGNREGLTVCVGLSLLVVALFTYAQSGPALKLNSLGSNQFQLLITNAAPSSLYQVFWSPIIPASPWFGLAEGTNGQTNFLIDADGVPMAFFIARSGNDWDGDLVNNWEDADPNDASVGRLTVIIDTPLANEVLK
jgi:hypothetical protein